MADSVEIYLRGSGEPYDLMRALAVRGLIGVVEETGEGALIAITCRREETQRLIADLLPAVDEWRIDAGLDAIDLRVGERRYSLAGQADIARCLADLGRRPERQPLVAA